MAAPPSTWQVAGSYFEACNCDAICPCRTVNGKAGGRSTYGVCQFALSWIIRVGHADELRLEGRSVVLAGWYDDDAPESRWSVVLYVDDGASEPQLAALADIFLGRAGGGTFANYAQAIGTVHHVRRAAISLDHRPRRWRIGAEKYVSVAATTPVNSAGVVVSCGIPGHDHPGQEVVSDELRVDDHPLQWNFTARCGFATDFAYAS